MQYRFTNEHFAVYLWALIALWFVLDLSTIGLALFRPPSESIRPLMILGVLASLGIKSPLLKMLVSKTGRVDHYLYTWAGLMIFFPLAGATLIVITSFIFSEGNGFSPDMLVQFFGLLLTTLPGIVLLIATGRSVSFHESDT